MVLGDGLAVELEVATLDGLADVAGLLHEFGIDAEAAAPFIV